MSLESCPSLKRFCSTVLMDSNSDEDLASAGRYCETAGEKEVTGTASDLRSLLESGEIPLEDLGSEANRWFGDQAGARAWLESLLAVFDRATGTSGTITVLDSNGAPLLEGDSVTVIKDLKVKGGNSDLKRGTLIKKIRLTGDPELIECRVDGSVLVLRTEFLKKS